jgi:hypothetical protein
MMADRYTDAFTGSVYRSGQQECRELIRSSGWLAGALAAFTLLTATADERAADFAERWPLSLSGAGPWYRLELPLAAQLAARQADLGDLRIFDASGQAQPYALLRESAAHGIPEAQAGVHFFPLYDAADSTLRVPVVRIQQASSGTVSDVQPVEELEAGEEILRGWLLDTSLIKAPLTRLTLDWTSEREGLQSFTVEASNDLRDWQPWGAGQVGRLSFADERIEQHEASLPGKPARYLRLLWENPRAAPVLGSVQVFSDPSNNGPASLSWSEPLAGRHEKGSEYVWQLPASLPVERLKLVLEHANSLAPVAVFGRNDTNGSWQPLQNGLLYRLSQSGQDALQEQLPMPGQALRQVMLQIDERGGGLGVGVPRLQVAIRPSRVLFMARGSGPFTLALGNPGARSAAQAIAPADLASASSARVGGSIAVQARQPAAVAPPASASPAVQSAAAALPASAGNTLAWWLAALCAAILLAAMAWKLGRSRSARPR